MCATCLSLNALNLLNPGGRSPWKTDVSMTVGVDGPRNTEI